MSEHVLFDLSFELHVPLIGKRNNVSVNCVRQLEQSAPAAAPEEK